MNEEDQKQAKSKATTSKRLSEFEDSAVDGVVDSTRTIKGAVDTTIFGAIKGVLKGSIVAAKGIFSTGKTVTKETAKGMSEGVKGAKEEPSSIKGAGVIAANTTKGASKGVVKGTTTLANTAVETVKIIASETTKGIQKTKSELTDSKDKIKKTPKE